MPKKVPNSVDVFIGQKMRARRLSEGVSQEKLGDAVGVTFQQVQKYEKGTNRISASRLMQITAVLKVAPTSFFDGAPGKKKTILGTPKTDYVSEFVKSADGIALIRAYGRMPKQLRLSIVHLVQKIAEREK